MLFLGEVLINMLIAAGVCFRSVGLRWDLGKLLIFLDLLYVFLILSITTKHQIRLKQEHERQVCSINVFS
ncbi:hypothetical protein CMK21_17370 [Candidatus Poribacteria bacterium]|jgi:hypothetical protein|nr:hypothetical protein [Candidatus Poribacteria bacterium]